MALQHDGTAAGRHGGRSREAEERESGDEVQRRSFELGWQRPWRTAAEATGEQEVRASGVGNRSIILKFSYAHQDASMESTSNEGKGVHLHTLVDRERKRSNERG